MFSDCIYIFKPQILCLSRFVYPSIHLSISSSIHLSISQCIYLFAYPSIQLSICSPIYMAICICIWANCSNCSAFVDSLALLAFHSFYRYKSQWDALSTPALLLSRVFVFVCVNVSNTKSICWVCVRVCLTLTLTLLRCEVASLSPSLSMMMTHRRSFSLQRLSISQEYLYQNKQCGERDESRRNRNNSSE